jgi:hypothetical protein
MRADVNAELHRVVEELDPAVGRRLQRRLLDLGPDEALAIGQPNDVIYVFGPQARTRRVLSVHGV